MSLIGDILKKHPAIPVFIGFLVVIVLGTCLLKLPVATHSQTFSWLDALFTSTSAVCVTGLIVVDTGSYFTLFGQWVILGLIQIGGLGVMTIAVLFFQWIGKDVSLRNRIIVQDLFSHAPRKDIFELIKSIALFTVAVEGAGVLFLFLCWIPVMPLPQAFFHAIFHSVSAFCNAGFSLNVDSMTPFRSSVSVNIIMCSLIILGGIGFPVLYDLIGTFRNRRKRIKPAIQTRAVLLTSCCLIVIGALLFGILEYRDSNLQLSKRDLILTCLFQSVTCRTAGFNTVDIGILSDSTLLLMLFLMFFGASPGSCGGGVKTTTLAILVAFIYARLKREKTVSMFKKTIPTDTVNRSIALILMSTLLVFFILFLILGENDQTAFISNRTFLSHLFETVSAFGTVGLSMGLTPMLTPWGKIWIILMMVIGRIGVLTFAYMLVGSGTKSGLEYAEENVMIG